MDGIVVANGVVDAVLGMLFAVLFQQPLQDAWYRLRRRSTSVLRSMRRQEESGPPGGRSPSGLCRPPR